MDAEKKAKTNTQVLVGDYKFDGRPCTRYELFCERPHAARYAYRVVVYFDTEYKLPVRFEAYDSTKTGETSGELTECVSFVSLKVNGGLGESVFDK